MNKHINTTHRQKGRYNIMMNITKEYTGTNPETGELGEKVAITWRYGRHGLEIDSRKGLGDTITFWVTLNKDKNRLGIDVGSLSDTTTDAFADLSYWITQYGYAEQAIIDDMPNIELAFKALKG